MSQRNVLKESLWEWVIKQVVKLEENRELDHDQALKHEDRRELKYQSNLLVKDMETIKNNLLYSQIRKQLSSFYKKALE